MSTAMPSTGHFFVALLPLQKNFEDVLQIFGNHISKSTYRVTAAEKVEVPSKASAGNQKDRRSFDRRKLYFFYVRF
jgi:hypothetical protein